MNLVHAAWFITPRRPYIERDNCRELGADAPDGSLITAFACSLMLVGQRAPQFGRQA